MAILSHAKNCRLGKTNNKFRETAKKGLQMNNNQHVVNFDNYKKVVQKYKFSIPNKDDWGKYKENLDGKYLYEIFYGKSFEDVCQYFNPDMSMSRGHELLYAPKPIFQYYIHSFILFLLSNDATNEPDPPSVFLNLLINKEHNNPKSVAEIFNIIDIAVEYIANHQDLYNSDINIYGDFKLKFQEIKKLCKRK